MSNLNLLLDIEGTIIESLDDPRFMVENIANIQRAIKELQPSTFTIFSFAWHDKNDIDLKLVEEFEKMFSIELNVLPKNDLVPIFKKHFRIADEMDFHDVCNSKEIGFMMFLRECSENFLAIPSFFKKKEFEIWNKFDEIEFMLIDDKATGMSMTFERGDVRVVGSTCHPEKLF